MTTFLLAAAVIAQDVDAALSKAVQSAIDRANSSIVRIDTVGGSESVGGVRRGRGASTGVVASADGLVFASAYALANEPDAVLVTLADGRRLSAKVLGVDYMRMLALLRVDAHGLQPPVAVPKSRVKTGLWAVAAGRTWSASKPSPSLGVISAVGRIWGRAYQTDAKVSPANYGGPLLDLEGRVYGVLTPLSPDSDDVAAGVEWYDSGIGFAVPWEDALAVLPWLQKGDVRRGLMGARWSSADLLAEPMTVAGVAWRSPAAEAGWAKGDVLVAIDGRPIHRMAELRHALGTKAAGDRIVATVKRRSKERTATLELKADFPVYRRPWLGIAMEGVSARIRRIVAGCPASRADLRPGDEIVGDLGSLRARLLQQAPGEPLTIERKRDGRTAKISVAAAAFPDEIRVRAVSGARAVSASANATMIPIPHWTMRPAELTNDRPVGLLLWIGGRPDPVWAKSGLVYGFMIAGVEKPDQAPTLSAVADLVKLRWKIDPERVAVIGSGPITEQLAIPNPSLVKGVVLTEGSAEFPAIQPDSLRAYLVVSGRNTPSVDVMKDARKRGVPVTAAADGMPAQLADTVGRWLEQLGTL